MFLHILTSTLMTLISYSHWGKTIETVRILLVLFCALGEYKYFGTSSENRALLSILARFLLLGTVLKSPLLPFHITAISSVIISVVITLIPILIVLVLVIYTVRIISARLDDANSLGFRPSSLCIIQNIKVSE